MLGKLSLNEMIYWRVGGTKKVRFCITDLVIQKMGDFVSPTLEVISPDECFFAEIPSLIFPQDKNLNLGNY